MTSFFGELTRRNVVRVAVAYAIVGWLLVQVADTFFPALQLPEWTVTLVAGLVILGFPLALILSWAYELTPEGMKRSHKVPPPESITHVTGRKLDFAIIGALVLALGFVVYNYVLEDGEVVTGVLPNSVAVLPFENLSPDPNNAYYAAGIHEEILNQLVKLSALNVIARTSMQQYANTDKSIPEIARELNVETVMEGSVRYDAGRIRITTQLNDGVTGLHIWSETYTRDFDDIFAIESDIAMNVANALEAEFSLAEQESIEKIPTDSPAAYAQYLRALSTEVPSTELRIQYLDEAIALDPEFAVAYATKALWLASAFTGFGNDPAARTEQERSLRDSADRALALDATLGLAHAALGGLHQANWRGAEAEQAFERAYQLSPSDADVLMLYGRFKRYRGEYDESIRLNRRAVELDPNSPFHRAQLAHAYRLAKSYDAAASAYRNALELSPISGTSHINLAFVEVARGNHGEAISELRLAEQLEPNVWRLPQIALAYKQAERPDDAMRLFSEFGRQAIEDPVDEAAWIRAYIAVGDYDQALERLEAAVDDRAILDVSTLTEFAANPWNDPVLNEPEFRELLDGLWIDK